MLKSKEEIKQWLDEMGIKNYTINPDLSVDVDGDVNISNKNIKSIPVQFGKVSGSFHCHINKLTSLEHCPTHVGRDFHCYSNSLTSLEHCPTHVGGDFWCSDNKLTSLQHCPTHVGGNFWCNNNKLTSLKDIHKQIKQINGAVKCDPNPIKSHVLGVFFIKGLKNIVLQNKNIEAIINKHLKDGDVHLCQEELIKAGFAEYAKL